MLVVVACSPRKCSLRFSKEIAIVTARLKMAAGTCYVWVLCGMRSGGFGHRSPQCDLWARRVTGTETRAFSLEVKIVRLHRPAEPQHMRNGLLQRLVHVGQPFLLFHALSRDLLHLSVLVSDGSREPAPCEKWWFPPSQVRVVGGVLEGSEEMVQNASSDRN